MCIILLKIIVCGWIHSCLHTDMSEMCNSNFGPGICIALIYNTRRNRIDHIFLKNFYLGIHTGSAILNSS